jgi:hypothetical protein
MDICPFSPSHDDRKVDMRNVSPSLVGKHLFSPSVGIINLFDHKNMLYYHKILVKESGLQCAWLKGCSQ